MLLRRTPQISATEAAERLARGDLQVVDVREPGELAAGRVPGAAHVPLGQLPFKLGVVDRSRPVAFLCRSGSRSAMATRSAANAGYDAVNVAGGILAWAKAGLPLTTDQRRTA